MQSVDVDLQSNGSIKTLDSTAILLDESTGKVRNEITSYEAEDVLRDLPVRVTTRYVTDQASGSDLQDLDGYSGPVEIEITLENLTVKSEDITYDAVGQSRTSPALVGVPLSIAASAALPSTSPSTIVFDTEE